VIVPIIVPTSDKFAAGVVDTNGKFASGVVDTGNKFAVSVVDTSGAPWHAKISNDPNVIFGGLGEDDSWNKPEQKISWPCTFKFPSATSQAG
jgi:hypothetical protein